MLGTSCLGAFMAAEACDALDRSGTRCAAAEAAARSGGALANDWLVERAAGWSPSASAYCGKGRAGPHTHVHFCMAEWPRRRPGEPAAALGALSGACTGWVQFQKRDTWWDVHAGHEMLDVRVFTGASVDVWETLGDDLMQSRWATSTRRLYQGWLTAFLLFCSACAVEPLPIEPFVLRDWLTRLATNYASGTVQIAASAVIGFCAMNNFKNPLVEHPVCKLVVKAAKRIRCGVTKDKRAALDAEFVLDVWRVLALVKGSQPLTIKQRRARCFTQMAFEAALRGGELVTLAVCDVAFVACGPACGHSCKSHQGSDAYVFCRLHKTAQAGSVKVVRIVSPERPTLVGGEPVSAVHCLDKDWLPFLREHGRTRHPECRRTFSSKFRCERCPALFCTFPSKQREVIRPMDISVVTEAFKQFAVLTQRSPVGYSSHSGRIGSFSDATAVESDLDEDLVARSLGWKGKRTPKAVYKRLSQSEARATGLRLADRIAVAAVRAPPATTPTPSAVRVAAPTAQSPMAATAGTTPPQEAEDQPGPACPLRVRRVGGREVCVGYQLGTCLSSTCPRAHVCHECGRRHPSGALCKGALRAVSRWIAAMSKDRDRR